MTTAMNEYATATICHAVHFLFLVRNVNVIVVVMIAVVVAIVVIVIDMSSFSLCVVRVSLRSCWDKLQLFLPG